MAEFFFHKTPNVIPIPIDAADGFDGKVIVIGAGVAGLMAGNVLEKLGVRYEILEANSTFGGRLRRTDDFGADVQIDLGAEVIHFSPEVGVKIPQQLLVFDDEQVDIEFTNMSFETWRFGDNRRDFMKHLYCETRFKDKSWSQWLETYVYNHVKGKVKFNSVVKEIDYGTNTNDKVAVTTQDGTQHTADKVICTISLAVLQSGAITFKPELPQYKKQLLQEMTMLSGCKIFYKMKERFFDDSTLFNTLPGMMRDKDEMMSCFYEYSNRGVSPEAEPVLCFVATGKFYTEFEGMADEEVAKAALRKIDSLYDGQATKNYIDHVLMNWSAEPYIKGVWTLPVASEKHVVLGKTVNGNLLFAGEAVHGEFASYIPGAAMSGRRAAVEAVSGIDIEGTAGDDNCKIPGCIMQ